jgi:hypothetical protein
MLEDYSGLGGCHSRILDRWTTTQAASKAPQRKRPCRPRALSLILRPFVCCVREPRLGARNVLHLCQKRPSAPLPPGFYFPFRQFLSTTPLAKVHTMPRGGLNTVVLLQHFDNFERQPHCRADCLICYPEHSTHWGACHEHRWFDID